MIPELGYGATVAALALAVWGAVAAAGAARTGRADLLRSGERAAVGVWVLITACIALMLYAFLTFDFSVRYVAFNTNRGTPFYYRITALWGALEGSIVLWSWLLSIYALIVVVQYRRRQPELYPWVLSVMLGVLAFFLLVMTVPAPPFERLSPIPPDGRGLNPLLEDSGMITHPVALYLGFTGFTVPFAFAVAALIVRRTGRSGSPSPAAGPSSPGTSSPSVSSSAAGGAITYWAGAATGHGIRWRTRPSCPGSPPPRSSTR